MTQLATQPVINEPITKPREQAPQSQKQRSKDRLISAFIGFFALAWLMPILYTAYTSLRPYSELLQYGTFSMPRSLNLDNYVRAWQVSGMPTYFWNSVVVTIPAVVLTLALASMVAFVVSRYSFKFNIALLMLFTAGNLLPAQLVFIPVFRLYLKIPVPEWINDRGTLYDTHLGLILIHVAFQMGFATFVLSNYMKTIPKEISESAMVDGAGVLRHFVSIMLPLLRPPLASLGVLMTTWIYNDFFWAVVLMKSGSKRPVTSALNNLRGEFYTDYNLLAAGAIMAIIPTLIVFFVLRKQFVAGLTVGATKG
jgi:multiple sugar transport system permease protein